MLRNSDIVILSSARWDDEFSSSAWCLAKEFAKTNRVFFVDHPFSVKDYFSKENKTRISWRKSALLSGKNNYRKVSSAPGNLIAATPPLTLPINWLNNEKLYNLFSKINDKILHTFLRNLINDFKIKDYVFINIFDPYYFRNIPADIKPSLNVYYSVDDISQETYIARHGVKLEKEAVVKSSFSLATSRELTRLISRLYDRTYYLPNAADTSLFSRAVFGKFDRPKELEGITKKIICYTGNIGTRINYNLLKEIAQKHQDKMLLLIGPVTTEDYKQSGLTNEANVLLIGSKKIDELPAYLKYVDCTIIPFEYSLLTKSIYPLKINEYLAAGKPVVSTCFSEDIEDFKNVAYVAKENEEFIEMIETAMHEDSEEKKNARMKRASENTWEARVKTFWQIAEEQEEIAIGNKVRTNKSAKQIL